jgi:predicted transcriptional regulator
MRISEIMKKEFLCIEPDDTLASAAKKIVGRGLSEAPVMGEGKFRGMLCTSDLAASLVRHQILNIKPLQADAPKVGGEAVIKHIKSTRAWLAPEANIFSCLCTTTLRRCLC